MYLSKEQNQKSIENMRNEGRGKEEKEDGHEKKKWKNESGIRRRNI